jgi:release factor glutamine methyltransferase
MTIKKVYDDILSQLIPLYGEKEAKSLAYILFKHVFNYNKFETYQNSDIVADNEGIAKINDIISSLRQFKPIQYILGETEFYNCRIRVNGNTLIPRPETEELVEWIIRSNEKEAPGILDMGTGSGCIAIALKKALPKAKLTGCDIDEATLETAIQNSRINHVKVNFIFCDIMNQPEILQSEKFDLVVSNPPYLTEKEKEQMNPNVLQWEPHKALFVPDTDPMKFYRKIILQARDILKHEGSLFLEINENYPEEIYQLLSSAQFSNLEIRKDLSGKYRMARGTKI